MQGFACAVVVACKAEPASDEVPVPEDSGPKESELIAGLRGGEGAVVMLLLTWNALLGFEVVTCGADEIIEDYEAGKEPSAILNVDLFGVHLVWRAVRVAATAFCVGRGVWRK